jgi:two-component system, NarL family, response regulator NreC
MPIMRIFIADDHVVLREGLTLLINAQPDMEVVGYANDGRALVQEIQERQAEIVIMDVSMPGGGAQAAAQLRQALPNVHVVALTRHSEPGYVRQLLQAGAHAYVLKRAGAEELLSAIRVVAGGGTYLDSTLTARVADAFVRAQTDASVHAEADLSGREVEVVRLIAHGYTNKEIAAQLGVSIKTTETYKARAMEKLGLYSRAALVRYALQRGWLDQH